MAENVSRSDFQSIHIHFDNVSHEVLRGEANFDSTTYPLSPRLKIRYDKENELRNTTTKTTAKGAGNSDEENKEMLVSDEIALYRKQEKLQRERQKAEENAREYLQNRDKQNYREATTKYVNTYIEKHNLIKLDDHRDPCLCADEPTISYYLTLKQLQIIICIVVYWKPNFESTSKERSKEMPSGAKMLTSFPPPRENVFILSIDNSCEDFGKLREHNLQKFSLHQDTKTIPGFSIPGTFSNEPIQDYVGQPVSLIPIPAEHISSFPPGSFEKREFIWSAWPAG